MGLHSCVEFSMYVVACVIGGLLQLVDQLGTVFQSSGQEVGQVWLLLQDVADNVAQLLNHFWVLLDDDFQQLGLPDQNVFDDHRMALDGGNEVVHQKFASVHKDGVVTDDGCHNVNQLVLPEISVCFCDS